MNATELFALAERLRLRGEQVIAFINDTRNSVRAERLAECEEAERARQEAEKAREEAERQRQHELAMVELQRNERPRESNAVNKKGPKLPTFVDGTDDLQFICKDLRDLQE